MPGRRRDTPHPLPAGAREKRIARLCSESRLKHEEAKLVLAETAVDLRAEIDVIRAKRQAGIAQADEIRSLPGVAEKLLGAIDRLGLSAADADNVIDPDENDDEDDGEAFDNE